MDEKELMKGSIDEYYARLATFVRVQQQRTDEQSQDSI
jgi:hypothetical protein